MTASNFFGVLDSLDPKALSERESAILSLAVMGKTDDQISFALNITSSTVNSYWVRIRSKLGPYSRVQIVVGVLAFEHQRKVREMEAVIASLRSALSVGNDLPKLDILMQ